LRFEQFLLENRSKLKGDEARTYLLTYLRPLIRTALSAAQYLHHTTHDNRYLFDAFLLSEKNALPQFV